MQMKIIYGMFIVLVLIAALTVFMVVDVYGLLSINFAHGLLTQFEGQFYCYDEKTTNVLEVLDHQERNFIGETIYQNAFLSGLANSDFVMASKICQSMVDDGNFPRDNQPK